MDSRKRQTSTASPAEPGELSCWFSFVTVLATFLAFRRGYVSRTLLACMAMFYLLFATLLLVLHLT